MFLVIAEEKKSKREEYFGPFHGFCIAADFADELDLKETHCPARVETLEA